ncbi:hypothetical protein EB810_01630 [Altererythrobacter sp. FM1]|uniref:hypothetical protein n=1 Tax=Tsuneonella flava TaxID=2055955 RepID=UPI000C7FCD53|nr:hypothetical protein [Tsuneonella flava]ROT96679.1 hypothetical protein EB810_01630 [Altererythrobacter sp. FM1]
MLHKFFEEGYWFAPKRFGYGAGMPIAWQGWVLLIAFAALLIGLANVPDLDPFLRWTGFVIATAVLIIIAKKRTRGQWRWRWGSED